MNCLKATQLFAINLFLSTSYALQLYVAWTRVHKSKIQKNGREDSLQGKIFRLQASNSIWLGTPPLEAQNDKIC